MVLRDRAAGQRLGVGTAIPGWGDGRGRGDGGGGQGAAAGSGGQLPRPAACHLQAVVQRPVLRERQTGGIAMKSILWFALLAWPLGAQVKIAQGDGKVSIEIDGKPFTDFWVGP